MPIGWIPKRRTIIDDIAEAEERQQTLQQRASFSEKPIDQEAMVWKPPMDELPLGENIQLTDELLTRQSLSMPMRQVSWQPPGLASREAPSGVVREPDAPVFAPIKPEENVEWWENPKVWFEDFMGFTGETMSKVPILPEVLSFVAPVFEWIQDKLEKPWASIITAPWSPSLPWRKGESWLEHQKREYEAWEAPTYLKGVAEFAMPLWWIPYVGWAGRGAKALGVGSKMARALETTAKGGKFELPSKAVMNSNYTNDFFKRVAVWAENKPLLDGLVRKLGGPAAFVKQPAITDTAEKIVNREIVNRASLIDMRHNVRGLLMPKLQKYGESKKVLKVDDTGLVGVVKERGYLYDVLENPTSFTFTSKEAKAYVKDLHEVLDEIYVKARNEGVKVPSKKNFVHRIVEEVKDKEGVFLPTEYGSLFELKRSFGTMAEGVASGRVKYGLDPNASVVSTINHYMRKIAEKRFSDETRKLGKTATERLSMLHPEFVAKYTKIAERHLAADHALKSVTRIISFKGASLPSATMKKINQGLPDIAQRLDDLFILAPRDVDAILGRMSKESLKAMKLTTAEIKDMLPWRVNPIRARDIDVAVRQHNKSAVSANKAVEKIYRQAYSMNQRRVKDMLKSIQKDLDESAVALNKEFRLLSKERTNYLNTLRFPKPGEGIFNKHPAFQGRVFDAAVVKQAEKALGDEGTQWIKNASAVSGTSRMLVATLDVSGSFIQGLAVLGRNPVAWVKAVGRQFEFLAKPDNLYKYMSDPVNMAIRAERISAGGSSQAFEFFDAMYIVQKGLGKIPVVGGLGQKAVRQTYGRTEAAFTGFGEVARNEMWKALRRPNMSQTELRELARTIDRMTGVMSTEALGIGITQRDAENAFLFFAPRYTRAGLSYVADVFKGGKTGAEARWSLGAMMAAGMSMYYGTATMLGQTPNLDPRSGKFMTIKIGDEHVGIGGMLYSLMRFGTHVAVTAADPEDRLDLVRPFKGGSLNRMDNPFIKFMYQKSAPLTGLFVGAAVEQKNYFGEPFESPSDWGEFLAEKVLPIATQRIMPWEEHKITAPVFLTEVAGGRTFPKSAWELREEARERYAQQEFGRAYESLPYLARKRIDENEDIVLLADEADERTVQRGEAISVSFIARQREMDDARFMYKDALEGYQRAIDEGAITSFHFKELLQDAKVGMGKTIEFINAREEYAPVLEKLKEPQDVTKKYIGDVAYSELMSWLYSDESEDEFGIFKYDAYEDIQDTLRAKYGDDVFDYVQSRQKDYVRTLPFLAQEYEKAIVVLKPYWNVQKEVHRIYGTPRSEWQLRKVNSLISKIRKSMRSSDAEIAKYYDMFYKRPEDTFG